MPAASTVSSTDVDIFRRLSNPEIVDIHAGGNASTRQMAAQMRQAIARATTTVSSRPSPGPPDEEDEEDEDDEEPPRAPTQPAPSRLSQAMAHMATQRMTVSPEPTPPERPAPPPPERPAPPPQAATPEPPAAAAPSYAASDDGSAGEAEPSGPRDPEAIRLEKQGLLIDLQALQRKGVTLSKSFTMRDSLEAIELELQKQQSNLSTANAVAFMRDALRMAFTGIEIANAKMGPILSIDGWAESLSSDMKRFDGALERLYRRYWRKTTMSPIMELAWIILGSLVTCHFKNKFFGGPAPRQAPQPPPPEPPRPPQMPARGARPHQPRVGAGTPPVPRSTGNLARPTLRPPLSMFGLG